MPRNLGTSRKGKPGKNERAAGMGKALQRAQGQRYRPRSDGKNRRGEGGMTMQAGVESVGLADPNAAHLKTMSVLELNDLDDFLIQADMANRAFSSDKEGLVVIDNMGQAYTPSTVKWADEQPKSDFVFSELSVPRRPAWDENTTAEELQQKEQEAFLTWRRAIAAKEEELVRNSSSAAATPFEKNLEVWRQLWRVLERSSCLLQLVDARNPLFYLSDDLAEYAESLGKPMMVLINKSDYLSPKQRQIWRDYLVTKGWDPVFFSAALEQQKLDAAAQKLRKEEQLAEKLLQRPEIPDRDGDDEQDQNNQRSAEQENKQDKVDDSESADEQQQKQESPDGRGVDEPLTREQLLETMLAFAHQHNCKPDERYGNRIQFGLVGFPNVGKSSVINVLMGSSKHSHSVVRVAVASRPGKTKHFQTLILPDMDEMMLCDCPGLVFPSFVSNTADLIAAGVYPIAQMRDHWPVTNRICQRIPREILNALYSIQLPKPTPLELRERGLTQLPPPTGEEFLRTFCIARSMLATSSGVPDYARAARVIINHYAAGKLLYCHPPPNLEQDGGAPLATFYQETTATALNNTRKLREKLVLQQNVDPAGSSRNSINHGLDSGDEDVDEGDEDDDGDDDGFDDDLLEFLGDKSDAVNSGGVKQQRSSKKKHWGKKDRKNRNKDPYGCHSSPEEQLMLQATGGAKSNGLIVKAGKYGRTGYTRPTTHAGARAATVPIGNN